MRLSEDQLAAVRAANPVPAVVARLGVDLRRAGRVMTGPCPICGGGPRNARFEVRDDDTWLCAVCEDGGDVIRLVERAERLDFRAAVAWLGGAPSADPAAAARAAAEREARRRAREAESDKFREAERTRLWTFWCNARPIEQTPGLRYLAGRSIAAPGLTLRWARAVPYYDGTVEREVAGVSRRSPRRVHVGPAMLAAVVRPDGKFGGLHLTWLAGDSAAKAEIADPDTGEILPAKKMRGSVGAGRIELLRPRRAPSAPTRLVLGEGIETTLSALVAEADTPVGAASLYWAAGSLGNLGGPHAASVDHPSARHGNGRIKRVPGPEPDRTAPALPVPEVLAEILLLGDGDSDPFTTGCALARAAARYAASGRRVLAATPEGQDFNDVLRETA